MTAIAMVAIAATAQVNAQAGMSGAAPPPPDAPARRGPPPPMRLWMPKKTPYADYKAPNRPWWKLADVLALHKGQKTWTQPIVRNRDIVADWKQIAPGKATDAVAYSDNRTAIIVWDGEVKVSLAGQPSFVARKGFEIDIPYRVAFTLEAMGDAPALYFEIHAASDLPLYPVEPARARPKPTDGFIYEERLATGGPGGFDEANKPYLDYYGDVVKGGARAGPFIMAQHMFVNNIRGRGVPTPPSSNLGHYHIGYDEFWFVMEGNVDLQVEGVPLIKASAGDVVSAAQGRWHRASFGGPEGQMGTRVAINPYPAGLHGYSLESGGRQ
ncbi:MAG: hypothetical protein DI605_12635 [Sphingomonas sp.]|nr:MAG: hypothetical protein DI605_12635 [Sphingomonas sp.]